MLIDSLEVAVLFGELWRCNREGTVEELTNLVVTGPGPGVICLFRCDDLDDAVPILPTYQSFAQADSIAYIYNVSRICA